MTAKFLLRIGLIGFASTFLPSVGMMHAKADEAKDTEPPTELPVFESEEKAYPWAESKGGWANDRLDQHGRSD